MACLRAPSVDDQVREHVLVLCLLCQLHLHPRTCHSDQWTYNCFSFWLTVIRAALTNCRRRREDTLAFGPPIVDLISLQPYKRRVQAFLEGRGWGVTGAGLG